MMVIIRLQLKDIVLTISPFCQCHISNWSSLKIVLAFLSVNIFWLLKVYPPAGDAAQRCPPTPQSPVAVECP